MYRGEQYKPQFHFLLRECWGYCDCYNHRCVLEEVRNVTMLLTCSNLYSHVCMCVRACMHVCVRACVCVCVCVCVLLGNIAVLRFDTLGCNKVPCDSHSHQREKHSMKMTCSLVIVTKMRKWLHSLHFLLQAVPWMITSQTADMTFDTCTHIHHISLYNYYSL